MKHLWIFVLVLQLSGGPLWAQTLDQSFDSTNPLTDAEQLEANNYYHAGKAQKILEEECAKVGKKYDTTQGCMDQSNTPGQAVKGTMGMMLEEILPKLYAMMGTVAMATGGAKIEMQPKEGSTPPAEGADKDANKKDDYCIYIPMAGEVVASGMQMMGEKSIQQTNVKNAADMQRESMYAVARTHDLRSKTATIQGGIYAATAACYGVYIAQGAVVDWQILLKLGAATVMSGIFFKKAGNHKGYAKSIREVAKKLPGAGDCNPHTQTNCFCSEPTSQMSDYSNWQKVCVAPELAANTTPKTTPIPCSVIQNGQASLDAQCSCKRTNSCLNGTFTSSMGKIGFGGINIADPLRILNEMNGQMNDAQVATTAANLNAKAQTILDANKGIGAPAVALDKKKTEIAKELNKMGLPARLAMVAASQKDATLPDTVLGGLGGTLAATSTSPAARRSGVTTYNYSSPGTSARRNQDAPAAYKNPLDKGEKKNAVEVEMFAEQAMAQADITKDTSKGLFDIISNRYRNSAWSRFEMEKKLQETPITEPAPAATP